MKFKNSYNITENLYVEQHSRCYYINWLVPTLISLGVIFAFLKLWVIVAFFAAAIAILLFYKFHSDEYLKKEYKRLYSSVAETEVETKFYNTEFKIKTGKGLSDNFSYNSITKTSKRRHLIVIHVDRGYSIGVKKDSFEEGTSSGFAYFMNIKGFKG